MTGRFLRETRKDFTVIPCNCAYHCVCPAAEHVCVFLFIEAIPIPADQPLMQIKDLDEVAIPTMEIKVQQN